MHNTKDSDIHAEIKINKGGPIKVTGKFQITATDGKQIGDENQDAVYICACGKTKKSPFCDGSHNG